jgi:ribonuclease T2
MFVFVALFLACVGAVNAGTINTGVKMTADVYVFAQSWQPGFCNGQANYVGCNDPKEFWKTHFTIHGLWPQYLAGGYPQSCTTEAFNSSVPYEVGWTDMTTYWPDAQYAESDVPNYYTLWSHEWSKHGTCTGLSQYDYMSQTVNLDKSFGTPVLISNNVGGSINAEELRNYYGGPTRVSLQCNSGNYLNGVYTCWSQVNGKVSSQIECPTDVQKEDTCPGSTINIGAFK